MVSTMLVLILIITSVFALPRTSSCSIAVATFDGTGGVSGEIEIDEDGRVNVDLNVGGLDGSQCEDGGYEFAYHIHTLWEYDDLTPRFGSDACGSAYTGGHFNPYGVQTCVAAAAAGEEVDYYNCEIGDLSGRDGNLRRGYNDGSIDTTFTVATGCKGCDARLTPEAVYGRSVVFHCNDGSRLFCAPFDLQVYDRNNFKVKKNKRKN
mmetsp:Transcript_46236/g.41358  ORF Transcript_46236/g.41358 Transcript_46236/m.41358 type:complete len:207 (+) Transcript_46236:40-660(+)